MKKKIPFENYWGNSPKTLLECISCQYQEYIGNWLLSEFEDVDELYGANLKKEKRTVATCPECGKGMFKVKQSNNNT